MTIAKLTEHLSTLSNPWNVIVKYVTLVELK